MMMLEDSRARLVLCVLGIMLCFLGYGIMQERIMSFAFAVDDEGNEIFFKATSFLVFNNRIMAALMAGCIMLFKGESMVSAAPVYKYAGVSLSNFIATFAQYEALKYVTFPTQTLGKCGKVVAVMIIGTLISGRRYGKKEYAEALGVTLGCVIFFLTGTTATKHKPAVDLELGVGQEMVGMLLMIIYLFSDAFTSTFQEKLFKGYSMSTNNQMLYVNSVSAIFSLASLAASGQLMYSIEFSLAYPLFNVYAFALSLSVMLGQQVIFYTIKEFGALIFATVMTTRQLFGILLSCAIYLHPLTSGQWVGTFIVFLTLYYQAVTKKKSSHGGHGGHGSHAPPAEDESKEPEKVDLAIVAELEPADKTN